LIKVAAAHLQLLLKPLRVSATARRNDGTNLPRMNQHTLSFSPRSTFEKQSNRAVGMKASIADYGGPNNRTAKTVRNYEEVIFPESASGSVGSNKSALDEVHPAR
jgi:hypothetical protein